MAKAWEDLHIRIETDPEYNTAIAYKGLTCTPSVRLFRLVATHL